MKIKWSGKRTLIALVLLAAVWLLYVQGSDQRSKQGGDTPASSETAACRVESTTDGLRVRSAPVIDPDNVVDELASGEKVDASTEVKDGFRKLSDDRWVSEKYVRPLAGTTC